MVTETKVKHLVSFCSFGLGHIIQWFLCIILSLLNNQSFPNNCSTRSQMPSCRPFISLFVVMQISRMLNPDKWQATFDNDGKVFGFHKALKWITLGVSLFVCFCHLYKSPQELTLWWQYAFFGLYPHLVNPYIPMWQLV